MAGTQNLTALFPPALKASSNLSDVANPAQAATNIGALQVGNGLSEIALAGAIAQSLARRNIGAMSRGKAVALTM